MKKNRAFGIIAIVGAGLLIFGLVISLLGFALNGWNAVSWNWNGRNITLFENRDSGHNNNNRRYNDYSATLDGEVTALELDCAIGNITIKVAEQGGYDISNYPGTLDISFQNGKLHIEDPSDDSWNSTDWPETSIIIYITQPALTEFELELGAGTLDLQNCEVDTLNFTIGAGNILMNGITTQRTNINTGAGSLDLDNCVLGNAHLETGVGDIDFSGSLVGDCTFLTGTGSVTIRLQDAREGYYVDLAIGVGSVSVDGHNKGGFDSSYTIGSPSAPNHLRVETGVGDINIHLAD